MAKGRPILTAMVRAILLVSLIVPFSGSTAIRAQQLSLRVRDQLDLTLAADGFAGKLELLQDARITPQLDKDLWQSGGPEMALAEDDPLAKQLSITPLCPAALRLRDRSGNVVAEQKLEREQARLEVHQLHAGYRSIFVTTDLSAGFGSYAGPLTRLLELSHGNLAFVQARALATGSTETISLASTLKTAWRVIDGSSDPHAGFDILAIACRPDPAARTPDKFLIKFTRYHWNGSEWVVSHRQRAGFWEADRPFPPGTQFPEMPERGGSR